MADETTSVTEESKSSGEANPMEYAPVADVATAHLTDEQLEQGRKDAAWIADHPNEPHIREPLPFMGGESTGEEKSE